MTPDPTPTGRWPDADVLRPSAALLGAQIALGAAIERQAVAPTGHDATTLDLLLRLGLAGDGGLRAAELCDQLKLSPSHVSRRVDKAEADGLVIRRPDPADRRAKIVALTGAGADLVADFAPRLHTVLDRVIHQTLDVEEIEGLIAVLGRIEAAAEAATATGPAEGRRGSR